MRLYIAGPMTGLPDFNYPAFFRAADQLASAGHDPIAPHILGWSHVACVRGAR